MICVIAAIKVREGAREAFLEIFRANIPKVRAEQGCIEYFPTIDAESTISLQNFDENVVTVLEKWESLAALNDHLASPHMLEYRLAVKDLVEGVSLKVLQPA